MPTLTHPEPKSSTISPELRASVKRMCAAQQFRIDGTIYTYGGSHTYRLWWRSSVSQDHGEIICTNNWEQYCQAVRYAIDQSAITKGQPGKGIDFPDIVRGPLKRLERVPLRVPPGQRLKRKPRSKHADPPSVRRTAYLAGKAEARRIEGIV
jgi:hypothetical protein